MIHCELFCYMFYGITLFVVLYRIGSRSVALRCVVCVVLCYVVLHCVMVCYVLMRFALCCVVL